MAGVGFSASGADYIPGRNWSLWLMIMLVLGFAIIIAQLVLTLYLVRYIVENASINSAINKNKIQV
jgi:hypothetical protein